MEYLRKRLYLPYVVFLGVLFYLAIYAFCVDSPGAIGEGLLRIIVSDSSLITDYVAVGGVGATLINAVLVGLFAVFILVTSDIEPTGPIIMALWITIGFGCFGKNLVNMAPITLGVMLYSKVKREPYRNYVTVSFLSATLSPVVSEICFWNGTSSVLSVASGFLLGVFCGFIFPVVSAYVVRVHSGYDLYSMGFAGGTIAMFIASIAKSVGIEFEPQLLWDSQNKGHMAVMLYTLSVYLLLVGLLGTDIKSLPGKLKKLLAQSGRLQSDFYEQFGEVVYFNMGTMAFLFTTSSILLGIDLNGATVGGIFTIIGFGSFGKHLKNTVPVLVGAVISSYVNMWNPTAPVNSLAILFSTGLAPIAGQFGWAWGVIAGFLHVDIAHYSGLLNNGLNLYNNGFTAGFVAMFLVPMILTLRNED